MQEYVVFLNDQAPAHRNAVHPSPNTELRMLPPYSHFLNIVQRAIGAMKAAIKAYTSQPAIQNQPNGRQETTRTAWRLPPKHPSIEAAQRNVNIITAA